ncbi:hypothetical protein P3S68_032023 [Capsicum galapagoense]
MSVHGGSMVRSRLRVHHTHAYYKCINFSECTVKKHVERAIDDPMMLIVTYEEEHRHTQVAMQEYNSQMVSLGSIEEKKE